MDRAIWAITYDLAADLSPSRRADYLAWFHETHIPEKLARPGYVWAAHYRLVGADLAKRGAENEARRAESYLALFAGATSRVFFDPSLSQLKERQDDLTRTMIGCRSTAQAFILTEEWREEAAGGVDGPPPAVVDLSLFDVQGGKESIGADEAVGAWAAQELAPRLSGAPGLVALRKLICVQGPARHGILLGFGDLGARNAAAAEIAATEGGRRLAETTKPHARSPVVGLRVWPR